MKESTTNEVVEGLTEAGVKFASFLPDSWLKPIYSRLSQDSRFITIPVSNEGVGVGLCCGAWLGGMKAVMLWRTPACAWPAINWRVWGSASGFRVS